MKLSLSVRIAEHESRKDQAAVPIEELAPLARAAGFQGLSMRASVVSVDSTPGRAAEVRHLLDGLGLQVSMVTGDLALAANRGPVDRILHEPEPYFQLAETLGCDLLRVMLHDDPEVRLVRRICDAAHERGLRLAHQTHWNTLFETVDGSLEVIRRVGRSNFGLTFEPANLLICGDDYGRFAIERLAPHLFNAYFQNMRVVPGGPVVWNTLTHGPVAAEYLPLGDTTGLAIAEMIVALQAVGYNGWFSIHQPLQAGQTVPAAIQEAQQALSSLINPHRDAP
jgi:sugar phosphate isomerase/epimerase